MKWEPEVIHIVVGSISEKKHGRLCGAKVRPWPERCLSDEWARKLPLCEDCLSEYKRRTGRDYNSSPQPREPEQVGGLFLIDFGARTNKGTSGVL